MATIITRAGKGSPLENAEVDDNFTNLNTDKLEKSGGTMTGDLSFGDNDKAIFGAGSDLQIYHDGSNSIISDQGTGSLNLLASSYFRVKNSADTLLAASFRADAGQELYHNSSLKLATTSTGIDVTGTVTADGLTVEGNDTAMVGAYLANAARYGSSDRTDIRFGFGRSVDTAVQAFRMISAEKSQQWTGVSTTNDADLTLHSVANQSNPQRIRIASTGNISFYEDTGTTPKFFWDASAETLNLNNTSTSYANKLNVKSYAHHLLRLDRVIQDGNLVRV
jgi:hypothetical protein